MAKFYGPVGYAENIETDPGVWEDLVTEVYYYGDILRNSQRYIDAQGPSSLNDNLTINNLVSILADAYAFKNFFAIRYIKWMGTAWEVTKVEVQRPRLILSMGGVYNGNSTEPAPSPA
jgi:hypothetical protein